MDKLTLFNQALTRLGVSDVLSSEDDDSTEAMLCRRMYDQALTEVLESYPWRCVRSCADLAELAENPRSDYRHAFTLPADFLAMIPELAPHGCRWEIARGILLTDAGRFRLIYSARPETPALFPAHLANLVSLKLAILIAPALLGGARNTGQRLLEEYERIAWPAAVRQEVRESFQRPKSRNWLDPWGY